MDVRKFRTRLCQCVLSQELSHFAQVFQIVKEQHGGRLTALAAHESLEAA
jgi:hypothetical protein